MKIHAQPSLRPWDFPTITPPASPQYNQLVPTREGTPVVVGDHGKIIAIENDYHLQQLLGAGYQARSIGEGKQALFRGLPGGNRVAALRQELDRLLDDPNRPVMVFVYYQWC